MNAVEDFEQVVALDQTQELVEFGPVDSPSSTQQLLDELLGRFEENDSLIVTALSLTSDFCSDSGE